MTTARSRHDLVLSVHPTSAGFGWVLFEGPLAPFDWGLAKTPRNKNAKCVSRVLRLIEQYQPAVLVLEAFNVSDSRRSERVRRLCQSLAAVAEQRGLSVRIYNRLSIRMCFAQIGCITRQEIAQAVAGHIEAFSHYLPPVRRPWMSEDPRLGLFSAAAVGLCYYALSSHLTL